MRNHKGYAKYARQSCQIGAKNVREQRRRWALFLLQIVGIAMLVSCQDTDSFGSGDIDGDGVVNRQDNCLLLHNPDQLDSDQDRWGNRCDNCPLLLNVAQQDSDHDGIGDLCDNCPQHINNAQQDSDDDGVGDLCDSCPKVHNNLNNLCTAESRQLTVVRSYEYRLEDVMRSDSAQGIKNLGYSFTVLPVPQNSPSFRNIAAILVVNMPDFSARSSINKSRWGILYLDQALNLRDSKILSTVNPEYWVVHNTRLAIVYPTVDVEYIGNFLIGGREYLVVSGGIRDYSYIRAMSRYFDPAFHYGALGYYMFDSTTLKVRAIQSRIEMTLTREPDVSTDRRLKGFGQAVAILGDIDDEGPLEKVLAVSEWDTANDSPGNRIKIVPFASLASHKVNIPTYYGFKPPLPYKEYIKPLKDQVKTIIANDVINLIADSATYNLENLKRGKTFGAALASVPQLRGDSAAALAIGAPDHLDSSTTANLGGRVYLTRLNSQGLPAEKAAVFGALYNQQLAEVSKYSHFGCALHNIGDIDGAGEIATVLAVGACQDSGPGNKKQGALYLLYIDRDMQLIRSQKIDYQTSQGPNLQDNFDFGRGINSFYIDETLYLVVGAPKAPGGGRFYVMQME